MERKKIPWCPKVFRASRNIPSAPLHLNREHIMDKDSVISLLKEALARM
jgi:hypothetical protein